MRFTVAALTAGCAAATFPTSCEPDGAGYGLPFCDASLALAARVDDLVGRIPQADKPGLLGNNAHGVDSLDIGPVSWWNEVGDDDTSATTTRPSLRRSLASGRLTAVVSTPRRVCVCVVRSKNCTATRRCTASRRRTSPTRRSSRRSSGSRRRSTSTSSARSAPRSRPVTHVLFLHVCPVGARGCRSCSHRTAGGQMCHISPLQAGEQMCHISRPRRARSRTSSSRTASRSGRRTSTSSATRAGGAARRRRARTRSSRLRA